MAIFLTGRDLTPAYVMTPPENTPGGWTHFSLLHPLNTVPGLTSTSWNLCSFSHSPLCPSPRHSRSYLPASDSPLPSSHNQLQVGDSLNHEGKGYPFQYSGLENSMNCIVHGVAKSQTQLRDLKKKIMTWLIKKNPYSFAPLWMASRSPRESVSRQWSFWVSPPHNGIKPTTLVSLAPSSPQLS